MLFRVVILLSFAFTSFISISLFAQLQYANTPWVHKATGVENSVFWDVALDQQQNIFTCGVFSGTIEVGGISITGREEGNRGNGLVYKSSPDGEILWIKRIGGQVSFLEIESDSSDNLFVYVNTYKALYIDDVLIIPPINGSPFPANTNSYLIKFSNDGNLIWAKALISSDIDQSGLFWNGGFKIKNDQIYTVGYFSGTISLDGKILTTDPSVTPYSVNAFFSRYDINGNIQAATQTSCWSH
jgi:hypothetical protein